ncbi:MAG TPA: glycoside hydrolase family 25 protein [Candidatus Aquilonibacter sp.]|jgi:lysozyme|nr:glycoside hydrolase family 25 protein [Candidatus Aquilonibacter sp.]
MAACNVVIDLSHNNGNVDFVKAQANGVLGVIHKATQGSGFADPAYAARRQAAKNAGLLWGAYHFGTSADPVAQARFFLKTASPVPQDLVVLDFETNPANASNSMGLDQARTFISTVQAATGFAPGLYGGAYLKEQLGNTADEQLQACWLWWSQYGPAPIISSNWASWTLWQYTDGHHGNPPYDVDGVGPCDRDQYQGAADELQAKWITGSLI